MKGSLFCAVLWYIFRNFFNTAVENLAEAVQGVGAYVIVFAESVQLTVAELKVLYQFVL